MNTSVSSDRLLQALTALSLLITPVLVAVIGYRATSSSTSKDYVSLAVSILNAKDSPKESREWAATVLNKLSPVPVPRSLQAQLGTGSVLIEKPVTVATPIPVGCPDKKTYDDMHSLRPPRYDVGVKPHSLTDEELIHRLAKYAELMDNWADGADAIMKNCQSIGDAVTKELAKAPPKPTAG